MLALATEIRKNAAGLLTVSQVDYNLSVLSLNFPKLIEAARDLIPIFRLCGVLRRLLEEGVGIRNLKRIVEALVDLHLDFRDPSVDMCTEQVRAALRDQIYGAIEE